MEIALFNDITTESVITAFEEKCASYKGLYVDMDNAPERKYVKDMASEINSILKRVDRARIDKAAEYKKEIEKQAASIRARLEEANKPFSLLIDLHNAKRAKILAEEKMIKEAKELAAQIEKDHEFALLIDSQMVSERQQREKEKDARDASIAKEAVEREKKRLEDEEKARMENKEHLAKINRSISSQLQDLGLSDYQAKSVVVAIAQGNINNVTINY